jgi:hypothetical protein
MHKPRYLFSCLRDHSNKAKIENFAKEVQRMFVEMSEVTIECGRCGKNSMNYQIEL